MSPDLASLITRAQDAAKRRDLRTARADYENALVLLDPDGPIIPVRVGLAWTCRQLGEPDEALDHYDAALAHLLRATPDDAVTLDALRHAIADTLTALGRHDEALRFHRLVLDTASGPARRIALQRGAASAARAGHDDEADRYRQELHHALRADLPMSGPMLAAELINAGNDAAASNRHAKAEAYLREALTLAPNMGHGTQTLIVSLIKQDRVAEAREVAVRHYARTSFWRVKPRAPTRATLLTLVALHGNTPEQHLLARLGFGLIVWQVEFGPEHDAQMPPYDLVLNQISDPDHGEAALKAAIRFAGRCRAPILNPPDRIAVTRRDLLPDLLGGIEGLMIPKVIRLAEPIDPSDSWRAACASGLAAPLIGRAAGRHGGDKTTLSPDEAELRQDWPLLGEREATYLTEFHDYRSPDGHCRKYRVIFVDRRPFPYHLAISQHWLIHYFSADMLAHAWKREEELHFLSDMGSALGPLAMSVLHEVGRRMDLDFCGIDFTLLPDGRILLFEANATMLVHPEEAGSPLADKNPYIQHILDAVDNLMLRALSV